MADWDSVTYLRKKKSAGEARTPQAISRALAAGEVEIQKKHTAGPNKGGPSINAAKIEAETEEFKVKTVDKDIGRLIMEKRQELKLTQRELAVKINEKPTVVNEYESGKAVPNQSVLGKLERVLNVRLRGSHIGQVLK
jgi:putative transcription factor